MQTKQISLKVQVAKARERFLRKEERAALMKKKEESKKQKKEDRENKKYFEKEVKPHLIEFLLKNAGKRNPFYPCSESLCNYITAFLYKEGFKYAYEHDRKWSGLDDYEDIFRGLTIILDEEAWEHSQSFKCH